MVEIVAACQFRDMVLVFTRNGTIFRLYFDEQTNDFKMSRLVDRLPLRE